MKRIVCAILGVVLTLGLCWGSCASGLSGIDLPPIHFPLTIQIQSPAPEKTTAVVGESLTATWTVTGGTPPYEQVRSYWTLNDDPTPVLEKGASSPEDYLNDLTFLLPLTARFWVVVQDGSLTLTKNTQLITVTEPAPLKISLQLSREAVALGQSVEGKWQVTGGVPPYQQVMFSWMVHAGETYLSKPFEAGPADGSAQFSPMEGEELALTVTVTDSAQHAESQKSAWIPILQPVPIVVDLPALSKKAVTVGDIVMGSWSVSGGNLPYTSVSYHWSVLSGGMVKPGPLEVGAESGMTSFWPKEGEELMLVVEAVDAGLYAQQASTERIPILPVRRGDANQDGSVDAQDLLSVIDYLVAGTFPLSLTNSDANADNTVDVADLAWIVDLVTGS